MLWLKSELMSLVSFMDSLLSGVASYVGLLPNIWYISFDPVIWLNIWPVALSIFNPLSSP